MSESPEPGAFIFEGVLKMPYVREDGSVRIQIEGGNEWPNEQIAALVKWRGLPALIYIGESLPTGEEEPNEPVAGHLPHNSQPGGGRSGSQSLAQRMRFKLNGILADAEAGASRERLEKFYEFAMGPGGPVDRFIDRAQQDILIDFLLDCPLQYDNDDNDNEREPATD